VGELDVHFNGLLLRELRWLDLLVHAAAWSICIVEEGAVVAFILRIVVGYTFVFLVVVEADAMVPVEEVHIIEVTRGVVQVKPPGPDCGPIVGVEGVGRVVEQIR
jgi:hypothetical protein